MSKREKALAAMSSIFSEIMFEHVNKQKAKESEKPEEKEEAPEKDEEEAPKKDVKSPAWMSKQPLRKE